MMYFADSISGKEYSKDPAVVKFNNRYFMYYSLPPYEADAVSVKGWSIGVAVSDDLENWKIVNRLLPVRDYEQNGFCAPGAIVLNHKVHMFYQSYGNFPNDKLCHAVSDDGIHFTRDSEPIFAPSGEWNNGRAIDADVIVFGKRLLMYFATRDKAGQIQKLGVCAAPTDSEFKAVDWKQICDNSILEPTLPWERSCIEAPAVCENEGKIYLFYGGGYNNEPQQIGCAVSDDGVHFQRLSDEPFLKNGLPGTWNSSESGHPFAFQDDDGQYYLFYQGNADNGNTWYLSCKKIQFCNGVPVLA